MTAFRKKIKFLAIAICLFLFSLTSVSAGSANVTISGASTVIVGNNVEVTINLNNINVTDGVAGVQFALTYDNAYLQYVSDTPLAPFGIGYSDSVKTFSGFAMGPSTRINGTSSNLIKIVFKTLKEGSTTIGFSKTEVSEGNKSKATVTSNTKTITINTPPPPPSSNANLSSLSISSGGINFNKDVTNYSVKVGGAITSVNVSASAEDSGARVSGTGSKNLSYGDNKISVVVTAPSGATKTYNITVTREDNRSSNTNLSSLSINTGT
ncbi:MAG: cadherin-like beta sandwich domain-containing protein, partial [Bacilli bacterium]|nr:cadherin-like beta sandwich domain-containing protein [Bacilli bacterium]